MWVGGGGRYLLFVDNTAIHPISSPSPLRPIRDCRFYCNPCKKTKVVASDTTLAHIVAENHGFQISKALFDIIGNAFPPSLNMETVRDKAKQHYMSFFTPNLMMRKSHF